jgi:leader peptidase (prepilin peptidase)/N-methyltransferase
MPDPLLAAIVMAVVCGVGGAAAPRLLGTIPEPAPAEDPQDAEAPVKEPYAAIAALPGLGRRLAVASAVIGAAVGAAIGWHGTLVPWAYVVPLGVALGLVDWRTRLLPTWVIAPSYAVVVLLAFAASALADDIDVVFRAAIGWAVMGGLYFLLWLVYPKGMGYGDVRLSGLLGIALGVLGVPVVVVGSWLGFLFGGVGGLLLSRLGMTDRRATPQGPFMVAGAVVGVLLAPAFLAGLGY